MQCVPGVYALQGRMCGIPTPVSYLRLFRYGSGHRLLGKEVTLHDSRPVGPYRVGPGECRNNAIQ